MEGVFPAPKKKSTQSVEDLRSRLREVASEMLDDVSCDNEAREKEALQRLAKIISDSDFKKSFKNAFVEAEEENKAVIVLVVQVADSMFEVDTTKDPVECLRGKALIWKEALQESFEEQSSRVKVTMEKDGDGKFCLALEVSPKVEEEDSDDYLPRRQKREREKALIQAEDDPEGFFGRDSSFAHVLGC